MEKLQKNDKIGIIAPAGFIKNEKVLNNAILLLKQWGFQVVLGRYLFNKHHHFAGTDNQRLEDLQFFLDDPSIKAIWFARGGYGSIRIIDKVDFSKFKKQPKWLIGFSDFTVFHQAMHSLGFESIHSFMPTSIVTFETNSSAILNLKKILFNKQLSYTIKSNENNKLGLVSGEIIGGNLAIIDSLLGTDYSINTKNKILFIEEIGEYKYRIDRTLHSLRLNGYFKACKALIVGSFTNIPKNDPNFGMSIESLILNAVKDYDFPVCFDFPAGHITNNNPIIFGRKAHLSITKENTILTFENE